MTNGSSTILIIAGVGVALLALLLLLGSSPEPATQATTEPVVASSVPVETYYVASPFPVVDAGLDRIVGERETIELSGEGYDPNGLPVTYQWTVESGLGVFANAQSPTTTFTAPSACDCDDVVILGLTVTNSAGRSASDQMTVTIRDPLNCPAATCEPSSSYYVTLPSDGCLDDGAQATCPATPSEPCDTPCISEVVPDDGCAVAPVPCPCTESVDCSEPWQTGWPFDAETTLPKNRAKPSIDRHFPSEVDEGSAVTLQGYIRNPACQTVCFTWSASKGWLENSDTLTPIYHVPESDRLDGERVTISLIVYDTAQGRSYDQIRIKIRNTDPG